MFSPLTCSDAYGLDNTDFGNTESDVVEFLFSSATAYCYCYFHSLKKLHFGGTPLFPIDTNDAEPLQIQSFLQIAIQFFLKYS